MKASKVRQGKIRHLICVAAAIALVVVLAGCGGASQSTKKAATLDYIVKPGKADQYIHSHPVGTTVRYDLNGDGVGEDISVYTHEYEAGKLMIGNASVEIWSATPTGYFNILNVDDSGDTLLVGISDYGPSDDPETVFYAYDGTSIREVGYLTDIFGQNIYDHASAVCNGDGTVSAGKRWDVLGTWNSAGMYQVSEYGITDITEFYPYIDWDGNQGGWEVTTKVSLLMYEPNHPDDAGITVPAGTQMAMTGLKKGIQPDVFWVTFDVKSMGKTLGITVQRIDWYTCVYSGFGFVTSEEAFDGFFYAG